jgi:hypothetical protein
MEIKCHGRIDGDYNYLNCPYNILNPEKSVLDVGY